jgi:hypothetical protein
MGKRNSTSWPIQYGVLCTGGMPWTFGSVVDNRTGGLATILMVSPFSSYFHPVSLVS